MRLFMGLILTVLALLFGMLVTLLGFVIWMLGSGRQRWFSAWREAGSRYRALVGSAKLLPRMQFPWREDRVEMRAARNISHGMGKGIVLKISTGRKIAELLIASPDWPATPAVGRGWLKIDASEMTGELNRAMQIFVRPGNPPRISDSLKWQVRELVQRSGSAPILIRATGKQVEIIRGGYLKEVQETADFLVLGLRTIDQLLTMKTEGVEFVNEEHAIIIDDVFCPICTDKMEGAMVVCVQCKTPHCRDCWEYNGKCGMFACSETRFVPVGKQQSTQKS